MLFSYILRSLRSWWSGGTSIPTVRGWLDVTINLPGSMPLITNQLLRAHTLISSLIKLCVHQPNTWPVKSFKSQAPGNYGLCCAHISIEIIETIQSKACRVSCLTYSFLKEPLQFLVFSFPPDISHLGLYKTLLSSFWVLWIISYIFTGFFPLYLPSFCLI